jgi:hypothetical protein
MLRDVCGTIGRGLRGAHRGYERHARGRVGCRLLAQAFTCVVLLSVIQVAAAQAEPMPVGVPGTWALTLNEEFSSAGLNTSLWTPGWQHGSISGPMSNQCLSSANVAQSGNGVLYLQLRKQSSTCEKTTVENTGGLIESNPSDGVSGHTGFSYLYGYVEWRAWLPGVEPKGLGCPRGGCLADWPAFWSLSSTNSNEIDTMEGLGGLGQACFHIHPPPGGEGPGSCLSGSYAGWHTYGAEWEPGIVKYFYDGAQVGEVGSSQLNGIPQYLIADMVPPGCCGGPLVVPDELEIDYVRVWQHPMPPSATTNSATSKQPLQATLNGTVNPNGFDTHYYFQYGTSTSYGSATGEGDAGSGTSGVGKSNTVTLSPGTTYHYRIVASNAGGTTDGSDELFTTPGPVEAVTTAASGLTEEQATLNGTVNPRGYDAKYYFQYGETTSYGSVTPEGDAGPGASPVPESATLTKLPAGTTYHYRLVGTSGGVTSYGSDQTFRTLMPKASVVEWNGTRHVYYRGLNGQLHEWYWNGTAWSQHSWGYISAVVGNPSAVVHSNGSIIVYYRNPSGQLAQWWFGPNFLTEWSQTSWGYEHEVAGDPSAVVLPNGTSDVYYRDTKGQIGQWWYGTNWSSEWTQRNWGNESEVASAPSAVAHSNNNVDVYYRDTKGQIGQWWYGTNWSSEWTQRNWGYENEVAGDPSAVGHSNNNIYVYYRAVDGQLGQWWYGANWSSEWSQHNWGYVGALGGEPSAITLAAGGDGIYYGGTGAQIWEWYINGSSWNLADVGAW